MAGVVEAEGVRETGELVVGSRERLCFVVSSVWKRLGWRKGTAFTLLLEVPRIAQPPASPGAEVGLSALGRQGQVQSPR